MAESSPARKWNGCPTEDTLAMKGDARIEYEKEHVKVTADRIESTNGFKKFKAVGNAHFEKGN